MAGCCDDRTFSSCSNYEYAVRSYGDGTSTFVSTPLVRSSAVSVYVSQPSVIQVTFSGTITGIAPEGTPPSGVVGFQLSMYNVLGGVVTASSVPRYPVGTLSGADSIAVSSTYAWSVCAGTYVVNVALIQTDGTYESLNAEGDLCIVTTKK